MSPSSEVHSSSGQTTVLLLAELGSHGTGPHDDPLLGAKTACNNINPKIIDIITTVSPFRLRGGPVVAARSALGASPASGASSASGATGSVGECSMSFMCCVDGGRMNSLHALYHRMIRYPLFGCQNRRDRKVVRRIMFLFRRMVDAGASHA